MEININVKEGRGYSFTAHAENDILTGITMRLGPDNAVRMAEVLMNKAAPIIRWRNHPLKQWANRKTGKA